MSRQKKGFFSRRDRKPTQMSQFTVDDEPDENYWPTQTPTVPTGVVDVHESVQLPPSMSHTGNNHYNGHVHLPPISEHHHHSNDHQQAPHDHHYPTHSSRLSLGHEHSHQNHHHSGRASLPAHDHQHFEHSSDHHQQQPVHHEHQPSEHYHSGHHEHQPAEHHHSDPHEHHAQGHHHDNQQHHHRHTHRVLETFDPRWWYLPIDTVHTPKAWRTPQYHYVQPKWYEPGRSSYKLLKRPEEYKLPPRLHIDCRCLVCRPPREKTRGINWVTNQ